MRYDMKTEFTFGVDYYPEHWPKERLETDVSLMKEIGIEVVRMGEFSWSRFEPEEGRYKFQWLDEAIGKLGENGISTIIGTPTAAPPAWLIEKYPEILPTDHYGNRMGFGGRHHDCQSNAVYRGYVRALITSMAEHYSENKYVVGWQIDNELGNSHENLCMCDSCRRAFQDWLEKKYGKIENLNQAWGTAFWSQIYDSFQQIPTPRVTPNMHNPSLLLDWKRFCSDLVIDFAGEQARIIRKLCPHQFVTHNCMGMHTKSDYFKLAEGLDFVSNDQYPTGYYLEEEEPPAKLAANLSFIRGLKQKNFWMMELQAGATGGAFIGRNPKPGQLKLWTIQSIAHGADTIVYFRWRTCPFGAETYWHGILPHNGIPGRRYEEVKDTINQMKEIMHEINGITTYSEAAVLFDYDQLWAFQIQPLNPEITYEKQILKYFEMLWNKNIPVDFVKFEDDLERYKFVAAPLTLLMTPSRAEKLERFVKNGGSLLLTMRSGVKNENNVCFTAGNLPFMLEEMAGLMVSDYDCLIDGEMAGVRWKNEDQCLAAKWVDVVEPKGAVVLAEFSDGWYRGKPAVTCNQYGKGMVYYVATEPETELQKLLSEEIISTCSLVQYGMSDTGIEMVKREGRKKDFLFVMNHQCCEQKYTPDRVWKPIDGGEDKKENLEPYGTKIYWKEHGK